MILYSTPFQESEAAMQLGKRQDLRKMMTDLHEHEEFAYGCSAGMAILLYIASLTVFFGLEWFPDASQWVVAVSVIFVPLFGCH